MPSPLYPARHKPLEQARAWSPLVRRALGQEARLSHARWQTFGQGLTRADPLADEVISWMKTRAKPACRALIKEALTHGFAHIADEPLARDAPALKAFFSHVERAPDWVDLDLVEQGGRLIDAHYPVPLYVLRNMGLLAGYTWSDLNQPLIMTGALLRSGATRRVAQTTGWFNDTISPRGLHQAGVGYRATLHVRLTHATVRAHLSAQEGWDHEDRGAPINQTDMAATWLAFSALLLSGMRLFGVHLTHKESHAVMHLWKYACWLMGVEEHWLTDDERTGRILLFQILSTYRGPNASSVALARALVAQAHDIDYPGPFPALRERLESAKHLSSASLVLGPSGMKRLGLSARVLPWYPLMAFVPNALRSTLMRHSSLWQRRAARQGRAATDELVSLLYDAVERPRSR